MANIDDIDVDEEYGAIAENVGIKVQEKVRRWKKYTINSKKEETNELY